MSEILQPWCLILMIWGDKYSDKYVDVLVESVRKNSKSCTCVVLVTDRIREGLADTIEQKPIPAFFDRPDFFRGGYVVKLSVFHPQVLPHDMPCVYLDLDTIVIGDVGKIAALVRSTDAYYMLPPGNLLGFGFLRRWLFRKTNGRRFGTGNSSILAFHSAASPNLCDTFEGLYRPGDAKDRKMKIDDVFISWFAQPTIKAVPTALAVMFRREFLSRSRLILELRRWSPFNARRRKGLVAVTFNGTQHKPEEFIAFRDDDRIFDEKNRFGFWSAQYLGEFKKKILEFVVSLQ